MSENSAHRWQTAFEWCFELNIRPLDIPNTPDAEKFFMNTPLNGDEFTSYIQQFKVKPNSMPRKPEKYLELRMYGFVPYNVSEIQKGIQFGHAVVEYSILHNDEKYQNFAKNWKTFIILNGGTSNMGQLVRHGNRDIFYEGTLDKIIPQLIDNGIDHAFFAEPDMNNMLTAVVFLVDERVFNKDLYPDFKSDPYPWEHYKTPSPEQKAKWEEGNARNYAAWSEKIGGDKNVFLRDLLKDKRLA